jgi:hypothetical protein
MFETVVGRPITQAAPVTARRLLRPGTLKIYPNTSYAISGERPTPSPPTWRRIWPADRRRGRW